MSPPLSVERLRVGGGRSLSGSSLAVASSGNSAAGAASAWPSVAGAGADGTAGATGRDGAGGPKPGGSSDSGPSCPSAGIAAAITATAKASVRLETQFFIRDRLFHRLGLTFGIHSSERRQAAHDHHEDTIGRASCRESVCQYV